MKCKALATIKKHLMIEQGDRIVVGFSGGADSVALLYFLYNLKEKYNLNIIAVHLNHMLRGAESLRDENFARDFCSNLGIDFYCECLNINKLSEQSGMSIEEVARKERYKLFARHTKGGKVATAHTLSDNLETVLINLTRGTGIDGLAGIPPVRENIIRPLIECTRAQIEQYCTDNKLEFVTDSTNLGTDYTRNKIRHQVVPVLQQINPSVEQSLNSMVELLALDARYLEDVAQQAKREIYKKSNGYSIAEFLKLSQALKGRVLKSILNEKNLEVSYERIELIQQNIERGQSGLQLSKDLYLFCRQGFFEIKKQFEKQPYFSVEYTLEKTAMTEIDIFPGKTMELKLMECKEIENIAISSPERLKNLLDYDKIGTIVTFRQRQPGDKFSPADRNLTKTVKKLFNEYKVPLEQREKLVVLESSGKVIWIETLGVSEQTKVTTDTTKALEIRQKDTL